MGASVSVAGGGGGSWNCGSHWVDLDKTDRIKFSSLTDVHDLENSSFGHVCVTLPSPSWGSTSSCASPHIHRGLSSLVKDLIFSKQSRRQKRVDNCNSQNKFH